MTVINAPVHHGAEDVEGARADVLAAVPQALHQVRQEAEHGALMCQKKGDSGFHRAICQLGWLILLLVWSI